MSHSLIVATLEQKRQEMLAGYEYYSAQLELFHHTQGTHTKITLSSLATTNLETLFYSALVNSSNDTTLALSPHNLYQAYSTFYKPYICTDNDYMKTHKTPMIYHVRNSFTRINAVLKKLLIKPLSLMHHTTLGRDFHRLFRLSNHPIILHKHKVMHVPLNELKHYLSEKKCYDPYVTLSQPLPKFKEISIKPIQKPKIKKLPNSPYFEQLSQCYHASANGHSMPTPATQGEI
jgi:hypothetical protein